MLVGLSQFELIAGNSTYDNGLDLQFYISASKCWHHYDIRGSIK